MNNYRYSILTFIIGKNYEKVHQILNKQNDVEYILVTDDQTLHSNTWNIIYDKDLLNYNSAFERCFNIRYNVFKYCSTNICITIDGSMQIRNSLDKLIDIFEKQNYDICLMPHPLRNNIIEELNVWVKARNYPIFQVNNQIEFLKRKNYDLNYKGLFQIGFTIKRNNELCKKIDKMTLQNLYELSSNLPYFQRIDQTIFSYIMNMYFNNIKVLPVSEQIIKSDYILLYQHGKDIPNAMKFFNLNIPDKKMVFNKEIQCIYI